MRRDIERRERADLGLLAGDRLGAKIDHGERCQATAFDRPGERKCRQRGLARTRNDQDVTHGSPRHRRCGPNAERRSRALGSLRDFNYCAAVPRAFAGSNH